MRLWRILFVAAAVASFFQMAPSAQTTIPRTRLRIVYKETNQPVEWAMIQVFCIKDHTTREDRKDYYERAKSEYEKKVSEGKAIPYEEFRPSFRDWTSEDFKRERTCGWRDFLHAEDGWITIPEVSNVRMDSYEIEISPAGGAIAIGDSKGGLSRGRYDERSFPKFAALPEKDRVLAAVFTSQCAIPPGTLHPSYEEARFFLTTAEIILRHWPDLSAAKACFPTQGRGGAPLYKGAYWGFVIDQLVRLGRYVDPRVLKELGVSTAEISDAQRADLFERMRTLFCGDIQAKLKQWGDTAIPITVFQESDGFYSDFERLHCDGLDAKGYLVGAPKTSPEPAPSAGAAPVQPPPAQAHQKH